MGCLWILDASINISMEPFRALMADKLLESQRSYGFIVQTLIIGIGTWIASNLPWFISYLGFSDNAGFRSSSNVSKNWVELSALVFLMTFFIPFLPQMNIPLRT